jgi:hypothetical protein
VPPSTQLYDVARTHVGGSDAFDQAVADLAEAYADLSVRDHAALAEAVAIGRVQAETGV